MINFSPKHILLTGATGFIGQRTIQRLFEDGHSIRILTRQSSKKLNFTESIYEHIEIHEVDVLNNCDYGDYLESIDVVIHAYWPNHPRTETKFLTKELENSVLNGINLLNSCILKNVNEFVFISSGGTVYGTPNSIPISEGHLTNPTSSYGITKLMFEKYLSYYANLNNDFKFTILRISNAFGPGQNMSISQGVISHWLTQIRDYSQIELWGDGNVVRDYIYIDDIANSISEVLKGSCENEVYNISSNIGNSLNDIISILTDQLGLEFTIERHKKHPTDLNINILSNSKFKNRYDWTPRISLKEGIELTKNYIFKMN